MQITLFRREDAENVARYDEDMRALMREKKDDRSTLFKSNLQNVKS